MKRLFLLLALVGMVAVGCTEGGVDDNIDNGGNNTEQPGEDEDYITLNKEVLTFVPDGESVEVKVYSNYEWTLTNNCDWVTTSVTGGEASEEGTTITLTANLTYDNREGTIIFSCGKAKKVLVVSQSFKEAIIADENNVFNVPAEGGNVIINYQTSVECEVIIPEEAKSWISLAPATRALVSESATLTVAENTTYSERSAVVKVVKVGDNTLFAEYTINQVQNDAIIADENNTFNLKGLAQSINIAYQTNVECEVVIPEEAKNWISLAPATRALVNESATLSIAENNTGAERSVVVKVVAANNKELVAKYTITQNQRYFMKYTSKGGYTVRPYDSSAFDATIIRNEYIDGKGYIDFDAPITSIGDSAFNGCTSLTSITIPDSVTEIGDSAFDLCNSLTSVTIGKGVTSIGANAFLNCTSLTSITIPDSVTYIGSYAFYGCNSLTSVTIGKGVTEIGWETFNGCHSLTSVCITDIAAWCNISFFDYASNPLCYARHLYLNNELVTDLIIPDGVTKIGSRAFYHCNSESVTIPDSVAEIGDAAFCDCISLTSVTIGNGVTLIGDIAFEGCRGMQEVYCKPTTPPIVGSSIFYHTPPTILIYVPRDSVKAYRSVLGWSKYAASIVGYDF